VAANAPDYLDWMLTASDMPDDVLEAVSQALERFSGREPPGARAEPPEWGF